MAPPAGRALLTAVVVWVSTAAWGIRSPGVASITTIQ